MTPFRLATPRATYNRGARQRYASAPSAVRSDAFASPYVRANRNILRLKQRKLRLVRPILRYRRVYGTIPQYSKVGLSDPFTSVASQRFKRTWKYWRAR